MKNKQMYFGLGWVINFIVLLIFILIPKDNSLFNVLPPVKSISTVLSQHQT